MPHGGYVFGQIFCRDVCPLVRLWRLKLLDPASLERFASRAALKVITTRHSNKDLRNF